MEAHRQGEGQAVLQSKHNVSRFIKYIRHHYRANDFPRSRKTDGIRGICSSKRKTGFEFDGKNFCNFIEKNIILLHLLVQNELLMINSTRFNR